MLEIDKILYLRHGRKTAVDAMAAQTIPYCDLTFLHEGHFDYRIGEQAFVVGPDEAMFCPAGQLRFRAERAEPALYTSVNFTVSPDSRIPLPAHVPLAASPELRFYLSRFIGAYHSDEQNRPEKCRALLSLIVHEVCDLNRGGGYNRYVEEIKRYIALHLKEKIRVTDLARQVRLNPSYCSTLFRRQEGVSISDYITRVRITHARKMLAYENLNLSEIAEETGFCDVFYFSRVFKRQTGVSPSAFRGKSLS